jgi:hypothetical protein
MPVPPHPHGEPRRRVDPVQAAGRGGSRLGRAASSRAFRRASSAITFAGRVALGRAATRTRWRCISAPLCGRAPEAPSFQTAPRAKSEISCGVAVSKPTTSSMPGSAGSAMENRNRSMLPRVAGRLRARCITPYPAAGRTRAGDERRPLPRPSPSDRPAGLLKRRGRGVRSGTRSRTARPYGCSADEITDPLRPATTGLPGFEPGPARLELAMLAVTPQAFESRRPGSNGSLRGGAPTLFPLSYIGEGVRPAGFGIRLRPGYTQAALCPLSYGRMQVVRSGLVRGQTPNFARTPEQSGRHWPLRP